MDIFRKRRSIRKYKPGVIDSSLIMKLVDCASLAPSAANLQPVRYIAVNSPDRVKEVMKYVKWAGYVRPRRNPVPGREPAAFIAVFHDTTVSNSPFAAYDVGAAVQTLLLAAVDNGLGGCWLGAIEKDELKALLDAPATWQLHCMVALGYPDEEPVVEPVQNGNIRYYLDDSDVLHVPKRSVNDILRWANE